VKRFLHFVNEIDLKWLVVAIAVVVVGFSFGYWYLSEHGSLVFTYETDAHPGFGDALYFSIVTISSLGYGDIRPIGWARALVGLEVTMGLAFLGVLVAKISSVKQDYILKRMYTEAVDSKLATYVHELEQQRNLYRMTSQLLLDGDIDPELTTTFRRDSPGATFFSLFRQLLTDVSDLMHYEAGNGALFGQVDDSRIDSIYDAIRGVQRRTLQLWERDSEQACNLVLCDNASDISDICDLAEKLAVLGKKESHKTGIVEICDAIIELNGQIRSKVLPGI
jgi:hypothetical protein